MVAGAAKHIPGSLWPNENKEMNFFNGSYYREEKKIAFHFTLHGNETFESF